MVAVNSKMFAVFRMHFIKKNVKAMKFIFNIFGLWKDFYISVNRLTLQLSPINCASYQKGV